MSTSASTQNMLLPRILLKGSGLILLAGFVFFTFWAKAQLDWLLWASGLSFSVFLALPALLLAIQPDLAIALLNGGYVLFFRPHINKMGQPVNLGPIPRLIEKTGWKRLSAGEQIIVYLIAFTGVVLSLVIARYTFVPEVWRQILQLTKSF